MGNLITAIVWIVSGLLSLYIAFRCEISKYGKFEITYGQGFEYLVMFLAGPIGLIYHAIVTFDEYRHHIFISYDPKDHQE